MSESCYEIVWSSGHITVHGPRRLVHAVTTGLAWYTSVKEG
jgi:hypothetical protein